MTSHHMRAQQRKTARAAAQDVTCPYCGSAAELVTGARIYPSRRDLHQKPFFACFPCGAWVGCHPGTNKPLGRLANATLRQAKNWAHEAFDPLWRNENATRGDMYVWLAGQLGIPRKECHIGMFDVEMCKRVVEVCRARTEARSAA